MKWTELGECCWIGSAFHGEPRHIAAALENLNLPGVIEVVPAFDSVGVYVNPTTFDPSHLPNTLPINLIIQTSPPQTWRVPVCYTLGLDLNQAALQLNLTPESLIRIHSSANYTCAAVGFQPGFPYLHGLPNPLDQLQRLPTPRVRVPSGSIAVASGQAGMYPAESPGGWWLLGRTPLIWVDTTKLRFTIASGDFVNFFPISETEFERLQNQFLEPEP